MKAGETQHILYLPDGFGLAAHNLRLADMYAAKGMKITRVHSGKRLNGSRMLASGFTTTIVDYFEGDALPDCFMKYTPGTDLDAYDNLSTEVFAINAPFHTQDYVLLTNEIAKEKDVIRGINMAEWKSRHSPSRIASVLESFLPAYLKTTTSKRHLVGHCFGGKSSFRLAKSSASFESAVIFHPVGRSSSFPL